MDIAVFGLTYSLGVMSLKFRKVVERRSIEKFCGKNFMHNMTIPDELYMFDN